MIARGRVSAVLYIPRDAVQRYLEGEEPVGQLMIDGSDTVLAGAVGNMELLIATQSATWS